MNLSMERDITVLLCTPEIVSFVPDEFAAENFLHHSTDRCTGQVCLHNNVDSCCNI